MQAPSMKRPQVLGEHCASFYLLQSSLILNQEVINNMCSQVSFSTSQNPVGSISMHYDGISIQHARLGHFSFTKLLKSGLLSNYVSYESIKYCLVCFKAMQDRLSFPQSQIHSTHIFELIHVDLWRPFRVQTYNGYKYFLIVVDEYSRTTWEHPLAAKSNALPLIRGFVEMAYILLNAKIKP